MIADKKLDDRFYGIEATHCRREFCFFKNANRENTQY